MEFRKDNMSEYCKNCYELQEQLDQLKAEKAKLEAQIEADTQYYIEEERNLRKIIRNKEKRNVELYKENNQLKASKQQAEQKLEKIEKISKDFHYAIIPFHRGINHEMADRIDYYLNQMLQIIDEVE